MILLVLFMERNCRFLLRFDLDVIIVLGICRFLFFLFEFVFGFFFGKKCMNGDEVF